MKCKRCGKSFKDIKGISAHYRKAHPGAMKRKTSRRASKDAPWMAVAEMSKSDKRRVYEFLRGYLGED